jgi:hypothetical protein
MKETRQLAARVKLLYEGARHTLQPRQRLGCKSGSGKACKYPPHSPDPAPSDFYRFGPFENFLLGKIFQDQTTLQRSVVQNFTAFGKEHKDA